jgi:hypothetical protein
MFFKINYELRYMVLKYWKLNKVGILKIRKICFPFEQNHVHPLITRHVTYFIEHIHLILFNFLPNRIYIFHTTKFLTYWLTSFVATKYVKFVKKTGQSLCLRRQLSMLTSYRRPSIIRVAVPAT